MIALTWSAIALFCIDTAIHFITIVKQKERLRRITKALLMPLLTAAFVLFWFPFSSSTLPYLVVLALLMGCAGDIFLFDAHNPALFPLGLASFAAGHVLYIIQIISIMSAPAWWVVALLAAVYLTVSAIVSKKLLSHVPKGLLPAVIAYTLLLCTLSVTAACGMLAGFSAGFALIFAGTLLFLLSDSILSFDVFLGTTRNSDLKIMATYIAAQTLITAGFLIQMA